MTLVKLNKNLHHDKARFPAGTLVDLDDLDLDEEAEKELAKHQVWTPLTQEETDFHTWQQNGGKNKEIVGAAVKDKLGSDSGLGAHVDLHLDVGESGSAEQQSEGETGGKRPSKNKTAVDEAQSGSEGDK